MNNLIINTKIILSRNKEIKENISFNIKSEFSNWVIPGWIMSGPYPGRDGINFKTDEESKNNLKNIIDDGINTFICLQEELNLEENFVRKNFLWAFPNFKTYKNEIVLKEKDCEFYHFPIKDNTAPTLKLFCFYLNQILEILMKGRRIYIQCAGGHGRTGIFVACLLILLKKYNTDQALDLTQKYHDSRKILDKRQIHKVNSPSTKEQIDLVYNFEKSIK